MLPLRAAAIFELPEETVAERRLRSNRLARFPGLQDAPGEKSREHQAAPQRTQRPDRRLAHRLRERLPQQDGSGDPGRGHEEGKPSR